MILEGIVTTLLDDGRPHVAPMGPDVGATVTHFLLKPYETSQTYRNLARHSEGVLHITDDVLLLAQAAVGELDPLPTLRPAKHVKGFVLEDACRYFEFRVRQIDDRQPRVLIEAEVVHTGWIRDFFGFNRAMHAVVEAAILATRTEFLPLDDIELEYQKLEVLVSKTGGPREHEAFAFLKSFLERVRLRHRITGVKGARA